MIPDYQRPYSWGTEHTLQLLDDLEAALDGETDEPYFLGSVILVKGDASPRAEVIDGQQRLTTLSILFAVLRDLTSNADLALELHRRVIEPGEIMAGTKERPRLTLRKRDADFFTTHVQTKGAVDTLITLGDAHLPTDAQCAIRDNAKAINARLKDWPEQQRQELATMLGTRTFLVVVSTPDLNSAHRIFSVMNARGLDLTAADIFKSKVIGDIDEARAGTYADCWEQEEQDLGREAFVELFGHIRMIVARERPRRELLLEFDDQVLSKYLPGGGQEFVDEVLIPFSDAYEHLTTQNYPAQGAWAPVNDWLAVLMQIDNADWRPPALWAMKHHSNQPEFVAEFLRRLERLAASMLIRRVYATPRATRYAELLKQLEDGYGVDAPAFSLTPSEKAATTLLLQGDVYLFNRVRKYVVLRLDDVLANVPGVSYQHKMITVEHVLPQNPAPDSSWTKDFSDDERALWTHRLANLVLLNRAKNSEAQRFDFEEKKRRYFKSSTGVATFALTTQVLNYDTWTPAVLEARQDQLVNVLATEWGLH